MCVPVVKTHMDQAIFYPLHDLNPSNINSLSNIPHYAQSKIPSFDSFTDDYTILSSIAEGVYSKVYRVQRKSDGFLCAAKMIDKSKIHAMQSSQLKESYILSLKNERDIVLGLKHEYIIELYSLYESDSRICILMKECKGGELFNKIRQQQMSESNAKRIIKMICSALFYLHSHNIVYCDLKPENILFVNDSASSDIKLIDFGFAKVLSPFEHCHELCGTPYYTAPEVIDCNYAHSADMWSLGVTVFCLIFGFVPFYVDENEYNDAADETYHIYKLIKKGFNPQIKNGYGAWFPKDIVETEGISDECMDFIASLLRKDIGDRLTAKEALEHPWMNADCANIDLFGLSLLNFTVSNTLKYSMSRLYEGMYRSLRPQYVSNLSNLFKIFSANKDIISYKEFENGMLKCSILQLNKKEIKKIYQQIDVSRCGYIHFDQFLDVAVYDHLIFHHQRLFKLFCLENASLRFDAFLKVIHSDLKRNKDRYMFCYEWTPTHSLLINGYLHEIRINIKRMKSQYLHICDIILSFYDKNTNYITNI